MSAIKRGIVMAIDPGPHTGIAMHAIDDRREIDEYRTVMLHISEEAGGSPELVFQAILQASPRVLVVERFATGGRIDWNGLYTVDLVGQIRGLIWYANKLNPDPGVELRIMTPGSRRAFMPEAKAMKITQGPHELDALCHLLRYEYEERKKK